MIRNRFFLKRKKKDNTTKIFLASYIKGWNIGLANFIKTIFTCERINNLINKSKNYCIDNNFSNAYSLLFKNENKIYPKTEPNQKLNKINFEEITNLINNTSDKNIYTVIDWRLYISPNDNVSIDPYKNEWFCRDDKSLIDCRYTNIPKDIQDLYINIINKFEIRSDISENVNNFIKKNINGDYLGVHIRTWYSESFKDNRSSEERYKYYLSQRDTFIEKINDSKLNNVLICTDNFDEIKYILDSVSKTKNIIFYNKSMVLHELQNTFTEILLLSKSSYLIGTLNSTFTELAWWYSNCSVRIDII